MKKVLAFILTISMLFALSACNIKDVTRMATADGDLAIEKGLFNYYLYSAQMNILSSAQQSGVALDATSNEKDWETTMIGEKSAKELVLEEAKETIKSILVMKAVAIKEGITLTEEDYETVKAQRTSLIEQFGGRYNYEQYFTAGGFTLEDVTKAIETELYAQKISAKYFNFEEDEETMTEIAQEVAKYYEENYVAAKHILIMNQPEDAEADEEAIKKADADAKAKAEEIIKDLDGGADFDKLMNELSQDPGLADAPEGYVFTKGAMVKEFEDEAYALEVGAYSKAPVATDYGYHIVKKIELPTVGDQYDAAITESENKVLSDKTSAKIDEWAEEVGFKFNEKAIKNVKMVK